MLAIEAIVYDEERVQDAVLALMHLTAHQDRFGWRAWKSFPWQATDGLFERGLIGDPKSQTKSVVLTEEGVRRAEELFHELFGVQDGGECNAGSETMWGQRILAVPISPTGPVLPGSSTRVGP